MEANLCDINHLDSDVLLPPRKRLLAGLKKQIFNGSSPSISSTNELDNGLNNLMRSHLNNPNLLEIVESSRSAAVAAVKAAKAARSVAEEKAAIAAKAIAAAKSALELVVTVSEETASKERYSKKKNKSNVTKKHLPIRILYNRNQPVENCKKDEELARNLHRAMNSSPRISKNSSCSELKNNKHKRLKGLSPPGKTRVSNGGMAGEGNPASGSNTNGRIDDNMLKFIRADRLKMGNGEAETSHLKEKLLESSDDTCSIGRKRGRIKQKKLPLSICSFTDRSNPKEELKSKSSPYTEENAEKPDSTNKPLFSVEKSCDGLMPVETASMWKCEAFKVPVCVKQNKVMQS
ncbi:hypothetical protein U1Q18_039964 [Sarracenia purpurea var. burkii]